ncbi:hypothetical protein NQ176_g5274 [Zarea fungicola]|uniref:Uncharacterized protein n=1 Tax=Zarea fungicola TaxID=93591 RepID=A0ACC1N9B2_9HYPO|nr:hypothetical protein NQ176_g5274 [Lecanicillium fungicola]
MAPQDSFIDEEEDVCAALFALKSSTYRTGTFDHVPVDIRVAQFRANIQKNQKKRVQEQRQKEVQKREAEKENRKNLVGVRVVQKNLVYITGLAPTVREDELLKTLRKPEFFGQYGNIQKISISNRKSPDGQHHSLGIYVTFETPDEAMRCIQAVHGSHNGDRVLKAQHGTTKYCSAWLKNEKCNNPGSSTHNAHCKAEVVLPALYHGKYLSQHHPPPVTVPGPVTVPAPVSQPMARSLSKEGSEAGDSSALPSSANWARLPVRSRRGSYATSGATSSPAVSMSLPVTAEKAETVEVPETSSSKTSSAKLKPADPSQSSRTTTPTSQPASPPSPMKELLAILGRCTLPTFPTQSAGECGPPMFDIRGGEKRRAMREAKASHTEPDDQLEAADVSDEDIETGGSLALGGEPEAMDRLGDGHAYDQRHGITPIQRSSTDGVFSPSLGNSGFGIGGPNASFQGQGHNRPSSRFNFVNDNAASATNVKIGANPRIMAQQSAMMPNSFQSQGSQFYAGSMPGPPPGLKSTGTPPSMFAQGFGSSGYSVPKDNSNDILQSLIGRNRGNNIQSHETTKRESILSSLSSQYPSTTSTPAPASGLLASLYGNHPGAFQDFASKQKKKGKKHRHANTSSSGGSGLVDLADPSILQARMQHQSQSNAGAGQGLFNGQNQGGYNNPNMVYNSGYGRWRAQVGHRQEWLFGIGFTSGKPSSPSTILPYDDFPSLADATSSVDALVADETDNLVSHLQELNTVIHSHGHPDISRSYAPAGDEITGHSHPSPESTVRRPPPGFETRTPVAAVAAAVPLSRKPETPQRQPTLAEEEFPALDAPRLTKGPAGVPSTPKMNIPITALQGKQAASKRLDTSDSLAESRRGSVDRETEEEKEKYQANRVVVTPRNMPRTLRVMTPGRVETPTVLSPIAARIMSLVQRPETPASETQRKQRKDAMKQETSVIAEASTLEEGDHAPVIGRKKKQKKERPIKEKSVNAANVTEVPKVEGSRQKEAIESLAKESRAEAALGKKPVENQKVAKGKSGKLQEQKVPTAAPTPPPAPAVQELTPEVDEPVVPPQGPSSVFEDIRQSLWNAAVEKLSLLKPVAPSLPLGIGQPATTNTKPGACKESGCKCGEIQPEDIATLEAGKPVRKQCLVDGNRTLITPNGDCVRRLTNKEEDAFLQLQASIASTAESAGAFTAPRHQASSGAFSIIKGRAVPNGRPNIFPSSSKPETQDPFGKLQRDEALSYINQYPCSST